MEVSAVGLVLGAQVGPDGAPTPALRRRTAHAIDLWRRGDVQALVLSGDGGRVPTQAGAMHRMCRDAGLPDMALHQEPEAKTTEENLRLALPILYRIGAREVVVISDPYHIPRALMVARRLGLRSRGAAPGWASFSAGTALRMIPREIVAYAWYWVSGKGR